MVPWGPLLIKFLLFTQGFFFLNQNDIEFDLCIGHALVLFHFFWVINKKSTVDHVRPPEMYIYISIYFGHKTLFTQNLMIIITGTFRNTSKLYEMTLFHHLDVIPFTKALSHNYADDTKTLNACHGHKFHCRDLKFSDIVPNTITMFPIP